MIKLKRVKSRLDPCTNVGDDGASPVPEPATLILLGSGLVGLAGVGWKRFKK
ncbi:MAG: PEP-CTERM sorting domain-containing protein [Deltaproteobacteria bacterium]|nr:PEP-CTERM sorting domain-containing protein [Deltaproteobacteria bacterium]